MVKRILDICFSIVLMLFLSPLFILVVIAIKIDSNGPVFYRGVRIGRNGIPFKILKFRSMIVDAEKTGVSTTSANDVRITRVGKIIRKFKLDEIPQFINVLVGDMSIVGPRPQVKWAIDLLDNDERKILMLRPGITDRASIKFNNEADIIANSGIANPDEAYLKLIHPEKVAMQVSYYENHSIVEDVSIVISTIMVFVQKIFRRNK